MYNFKIYAYLHKTESGNLHLRARFAQAQQYVAGAQVFDDTLKEAFHRVGSPARWFAQTWEWDYPLTAAGVVTLQRVAEEYHIEVEFAPDLLDFATQQIKIEKYEQEVRLSIEKIIQSNEPLPAYVTNTFNGSKNPLRHQQISFHWGVRVTGLFLAHDPGLGKTRSGIDIARGWYDNRVIRFMEQVWIPRLGRWGVRGGILVVCPNAMQRTWKDEMAQWQGMTALEITGGKKRKEILSGTLAHAHIVGYQSLHIVEANQYDAIIIDEIHSCANNSQRTAYVLEHAQKARRRIGLSGTPVSNSLESVFYQMLIIDGGRALGPSKTAFLEKYFDTEVTRNGATENTPKENAQHEIAKAMARCTYFLKKDDALDLPPRVHSPIKLEMTDDQRKYYEHVKKETITYIEDSTVTVEMAVARMMKLRQICQGFVYDDQDHARWFNNAKHAALVELLQTTLVGRKVVVWCAFTPEIEAVCTMLRNAGVGFVRLDGQVTSKAERDANLKAWNTDPRITVFVGQIQLGVGITLHANDCEVPCYECIYLGWDWSYVNWTQSVDRIHRIGQKYACTYRYLMMDGGVDERIYDALQAKAGVSGAVHKTGKEFFRSLLVGDVPSLAALDNAAA